MKSRNLLLLLGFLCLWLPSARAQGVPEGITYQAVARNNNALLADETFTVRFTLFEGGTPRYQETQAVTTNQFGVFSCVIGQGQVISGNFATLNWATGSWFLQVEVNTGSGFFNLGTNQLESVPFAQYAGKASSVDNMSIGDLVDVVAPAPDTGDVLKFDGTQWVASPDGGNSVIAGTGLVFSGDTLNSIGDPDPSDDIVVGSLAGGDLTGTYPNPDVAGIQGNPVAATAPSQDYVLKWNGTEWAPAPDNVTTGGGVNTTARISGDGGIGNELDIAQQNATVGQVLKWNGFFWGPATDNTGLQTLSLTGTILSLTPGGGSVNLPVTSYQAGNGIQIAGPLITNTGDTDPSDDVTVGSPAGGDLFGPMPTPQVIGLRGVSISVVPATNNQVLKFIGGQWEPANDAVNDADSDPNNEIQVLSQPNPTTIQLSKGGGTATIPSYTAGLGINISGFQISNIGDLNGADDVLLTSQPASGDVTGTFQNGLSVIRIQGRAVAAATPAVGQVLRFQNGEWQPGTNNDADADATNELQNLTLNGFQLGLTNSPTTVTLPAPPTYLAGAGINITGTTITNTGDIDASDDLTVLTQFGQDVSGLYNNLRVERIQGRPVSNNQPGTGQVLKWNGAQWAPEDDEVDDADIDPINEIQVISQSGNQLNLSKGGGTVTLYQAGTGISLSGNVINNTGDTNASDDVLKGSPAGGDLGGTYPDPIVTRIQQTPVASLTPSFGEVLKFIGGQWVPAQDEFEDADSDPSNEFQNISSIGNQLTLSDNGGTITMYQAGNGISVTGNVIGNTGDLNGNDDVNIGSAALGDLTGTYPAPTVARIQGQLVTNQIPSNNQILKYQNNQWALANDLVDDADNNPTNEIQTLTANANQLTLSNGGNTVTLYQVGAGLSLTGNTIANTGDLNGGDDVLQTTPFGGDVSGTFNNLQVNRLRGNPISPAPLSTNGLILKWNATLGQWEPAADDNTTYTPGAGISFTGLGGTTITNTGDLNAGDDVLIGSAAGGDLGGTYPNPSVERIKGVQVANIPAGFGDILKLIGGQWVPSIDETEDADSDPSNEFQTISANGNQLTLSDLGGTVTMYQAGTGISVTGNTIANTGDLNGNDDINIGTPAQGDLSGTYPAPTVAAIQGQDISSQNPVAGQVLKFLSNQWTPAQDLVDDADPNPTNEIQSLTQTGNQLTLSLGGGTTTLFQAGAGINVTGNTISNTGDLNGGDDVLLSTVAAGDVTGNFANLSVIRLRGNNLAATNPTINGQVLKWNNTTSEWEPGSDLFEDADADPVNELQTVTQTGNQFTLSNGGGTVTMYQAGTGISVTGNTINNTGDLDGNDDVNVTTNAGGDASGVFSNLTVTGLQGNPVAAVTPATNGDVLKWNGLLQQWEPGADGNTTYTAGAGIDVTGSVITNTGDTNASDDVTISSIAGGDATGVFSNLTITGIQGSPVANTPPTSTGQLLKWDNTAGQWILGNDLVDDADANPANELQTLSQTNNQLTLSNGGGTVTLFQAGNGISVVGNVITNIGDTNPSDDILVGTAAAGDLSGTYPAPTVSRIQGQTVSPGVPNSNEVLKYIAGIWQPSSDLVNDADADPANELQTVSQSGNQFTLSNGGGTVTMYQAGTGISVSGNTISNAGDLSSTNELQTISQTNNELTLSNGGGTVTLFQAGNGISVSGNTITNTGDTNAADDLTTSSTAGGDASGTFANLTVTGLQGTPVSATAPGTNGQVLKYNSISGEWEPGSDDGTTYTAGTGIDVTGTVITNTGDLSATNELQTISQTANQLTLSNGGGSVTLFTAGTGIIVSGNSIINSGDTDPSNDLTIGAAATGDLSGTYPAPTVARIQGQPVANIVPVAGQILKYSAGGQWVPGGDAVDDADANPTNELQTISQTANQLTLSNGGGTVTLFQAGTGISVSGNTITNSGDTNAADDITTSSTAGGDVTGPFANLSVTGLQGTPVSATAPVSNGQVLKYNSVSGEWEPGSDDGTTYTAGTGIDVTGTVITNTGDLSATNELQTVSQSGNQFTLSNGGGTVTMYQAGTGISVSGNTITNSGDTNASDDITTSSTAGGDASGTFANLTVTGLQGTAVSATSPSSNGQVLKYNSVSGEWEPGTDDGNVYTAGSGIDVTGTVITNTGDLSATNELQTISQTANQLTLSNGGGSVTLFTAGTGIIVSGNSIINSGDTDPSNDLTIGAAATGDLSGTYPAPTVAAIQGQPVANIVPVAGQILKYSAGGQWVPGGDAVDDADANPTNELQTISQTNNELTMSNGGGTVTLFQAGTGISVSGNTITNTGDTNAADDLTTSSTAGGDASGPFANLSVTGLQGTPVSATAPVSNGQVLKYNLLSGEWEPATDDGSNYSGGTGIDVTGTVITNTGDTNASDDITTATAAAGDVSGTFPTLSVVALQGTSVSPNVPTTNGQVLKWNSGTSEWEPGTDATGDADANPTNELQTISQTNNQLTLSNGGGTVTLFTAGTGISVTSNVISNTGDTNASDDITTATTAGGDLDGNYPNPTVVGLQGYPVVNLIPANKQVLKFTNGQWVASADSVNDADADASNELQALSQTGNQLTLSNGGGTITMYQAGTGISVSGNTIANTGDLDGSDDVLTTDLAGGDVDGNFSSLTVVGLQGQTVSATAPTFSGQVLKWNAASSQWEPGTDAGIAYTAGPGISIVGPIISNSGDLNPFDDLTTGTVFGGDVSGLYTNLDVVALQGSPVSTSAPTSDGQVLRWNSSASQWEPGTNDDADADATNEIQTLSQSGNQLTLSIGGGTVTMYQAGTGITVSGNTIINSGDTNAGDDITNVSAAGGDITGTFSALTVAAIQGNAVAASIPTITGQVLKWDAINNVWDLGIDNNTTYTPGTGISFAGTTINNSGDTNGNDDVLLTTAATGDVSGDFTNGLTVTALQGSNVSTAAPTTSGQVLKWNTSTSAWEPGTDNNTTYTAGTGINITGGNVVINTGDTNAADDITTATAAAGDLSGTYGAPVTVTGLQGNDVSVAVPTITGQVLKWDNGAAEWAPGTDENTTYTAGTGISLTGTTFANTGDINASDDVLLTTAATGDVTGDFTNGLDVVAIRGSAVSATAPTVTGQVLKWNNVAAEWEAGADENTTYTAGTGLSLTGTTFANTGDTDAADDVLLTTPATGDVTGDFTNGLDVVAIQGNAISAAAPENNEYLRFDGTTWVSDSLNVADVRVDASWVPTTTDVYDLGSASLKWNDIWAVNATIQTSDMRAKRDIENLDYGLAEIMALRPVSYRWISRPEEGRKIGLIAQEVVPVVSEVVRTHQVVTDPATGITTEVELPQYGMSYSDLVPVLINGMQEQQGQIQTQQQLIEAQAELIRKLEQRVEALEQR